MTSVLLVYPYFKPRRDRSIFRFPPLGLSYVAASLRKAGYPVRILDCTFTDRADALNEAVSRRPDVVGVCSMAGMQEDSLAFARRLRGKCQLLVAGGPLPTCDPASFVNDFDVVVRGEGERALVEVLAAHEGESSPDSIPGIAFRGGNGRPGGNRDGEIVLTPPRQLEADLDEIPFPARDLLPNQKYIDHLRRRFGQATTTVMTTRGCPFTCEYCSSAVFGVSYRERSPGNVIDEVEQALSLGYDRIHFADDVFTLRKERVLRVCREIRARGLHFKWECLGRVDSADRELLMEMKEAGCDRIFFGIESGNEQVLGLMRKRISLESARVTVETAHSLGIRTGAFFILCYPGETDRTVLNTIRFANSLTLDYLSFTRPYILAGTALYERVRSRIPGEGGAPGRRLFDRSLVFDAEFSRRKMEYAVMKGNGQFWLGKRLGRFAFLVAKPFEIVTDAVFRLMK
ncbi:MAG: radical SAM protein [Dehalococcoidia bacterium]|nr:radical SAM protein [Dehalococcoidia bacterium]